MSILKTKRLILCELDHQHDDEFILTLVNEPSWIEYIGDRGVNNLEDARRYIINGPRTSYQQHGFGLYLCKLKQGNTSIGICGLLQRDYLDYPDLGFAFLPKFSGHGYAYEAASATLEYAKNHLHLGRVLAVTAINNDRSIKLLGKLGFCFEKQGKLSDDYDESKLFSIDL